MPLRFLTAFLHNGSLDSCKVNLLYNALPRCQAAQSTGTRPDTGRLFERGMKGNEMRDERINGFGALDYSISRCLDSGFAGAFLAWSASGRRFHRQPLMPSTSISDTLEASGIRTIVTLCGGCNRPFGPLSSSLLVLVLGTNGQDVVIDVEMDVFLAEARQVGPELVAVRRLGNVGAERIDLLVTPRNFSSICSSSRNGL